MKYNEMRALIADLILLDGTYIAKLNYSYQSELYGTFDECESWEVFSFDGNTITWFNDWYEGQDNCYFDEIVSINELLRAHRIVKKIKGLRGSAIKLKVKVAQLERAGWGSRVPFERWALAQVREARCWE